MRNIYILVFGLLFTGMTQGCVRSVSSKGEPEPADDNLIEFYAGIDDVVTVEEGTKGFVDAWMNTSLAFFCGNESYIYDRYWTAFISMHRKVIFSPIRAYSADGLDHYVKGFNPRPLDYDVNFGTCSYILTGQEDIMVSSELNVGNINNPVRDQEVYFTHLLSQLYFTVYSNPAAPYPTNTVITEIIVEAINAAAPLRDYLILDVLNETIAFVGTTGGPMIAYDSSVGPGIPVKLGENTKVAAAMFEPGKPVKFTVKYINDITGEENVKVFQLPAITPAPKTAYEVKLTFDGAGLDVSEVKISSWIGSGSYSQYIW